MELETLPLYTRNNTNLLKNNFNKETCSVEVKYLIYDRKKKLTMFLDLARERSRPPINRNLHVISEVGFSILEAGPNPGSKLYFFSQNSA